MKQVICSRRGMSVVELVLYALVASLILGFFIFFFWRTRRVHEQQNLEIIYQGSFAKICEQLERDLSGCKSWELQNVMGSDTFLLITRLEGDITYDAKFETGDIKRNMKESSSTFSFKGEREGFLKYIGFAEYPDKPNILSLKIDLETVPPIKLTHDFSVRISANDDSGFFRGTPDLHDPEIEAGAKAGIGITIVPKPMISPKPTISSGPSCPRPGGGQKPVGR
ncbi:MAG: hypothetical protein KKB51_19925 [Candidatus Riflebacteria bacterium]|nr:hypothetical protein [Candidatus Riflebacteria bacterium]